MYELWYEPVLYYVNVCVLFVMNMHAVLDIYIYSGTSLLQTSE